LELKTVLGIILQLMAIEVLGFKECADIGCPLINTCAVVNGEFPVGTSTGGVDEMDSMVNVWAEASEPDCTSNPKGKFDDGFKRVSVWRKGGSYTWK